MHNLSLIKQHGDNCMTFNSLKRLCATLLLFASSVLVYGETTILEIDKQSLISTSNNSLNFKATASSGISYKGSLVCFNQEPNYKEGSIYVLAGVDKVRFRKRIRPGDNIDLFSKVVSEKRGIWKFDCRAELDNELVCSISPFLSKISLFF